MDIVVLGDNRAALLSGIKDYVTQCLSNIACQGFTAAFDTTSSEPSEVIFFASAQEMLSSPDNGAQSRKSHFFIRHVVDWRPTLIAPLRATSLSATRSPQFAIEVLSGPRRVVHPTRMDGFALTQQISFHVVDWELLHAAVPGGARCEIFAIPPPTSNVLERQPVGLLMESSEVAVVDGTAICPMGATVYTAGALYRVALLFAPLPLTAAQHHSHRGSRIGRSITTSYTVHTTTPAAGSGDGDVSMFRLIVDGDSASPIGDAFVIFSVVVSDPATVATTTMLDDSAKLLLRAQALWKASPKVHPLSTVTISVTVTVLFHVYNHSRRFFDELIAKAADAPPNRVTLHVHQRRGDTTSLAIGAAIDLVASVACAGRPPILVAHAKAVQGSQWRFQRPVDYVAFFSDSFLLESSTDPEMDEVSRRQRALRTMRMPFVSPLLLETVARPRDRNAVAAVLSNMWVGAVLNSRKLIQRATTPSLPTRAAELKGAGVVLSYGKAAAFADHVHKVLTPAAWGAMCEATPASHAAGGGSATTTVMDVLAEVVLSAVSFDDCAVRRVPGDLPVGSADPADDCAWILSPNT